MRLSEENDDSSVLKRAARPGPQFCEHRTLRADVTLTRLRILRALEVEDDLTMLALSHT
ncbi:protein of unknown function [Burkholderia multivorans]